MAVTPDGATAYVANFNSGDVTPIDVATNTRRHRHPTSAAARKGWRSRRTKRRSPRRYARRRAGLAGAEGVVAVAPLGLQASSVAAAEYAVPDARSQPDRAAGGFACAAARFDSDDEIECPRVPPAGHG